MLDGNTNKVTWVAIATGVVAILGLASMALFPSAMGSAKDNITGMVTHFAKASSDVNSSDASSNAIDASQLVSGSKLTKSKFVALYGESTLGDRDAKTVDLNKNQRTRVFDNARVMSIMQALGEETPSDAGSQSVPGMELPSYLKSQTDLPDGKILPGVSYVFDENNQPVNVSNISDGARYHIGLVVTSGDTVKSIKSQFVNFAIDGSQLKQLIASWTAKFGGWHMGSNPNFSTASDSPLVSNNKAQTDEAMSENREQAEKINKLPANDRQYLMDFTLYGRFLNAANSGKDDSLRYTATDLKSIYTYQ